MFRRDTGFDTAYVGSSNLSRPPCSMAWSGTSGSPGRHAGAAGEVPRHLRHLLERRELRDLRPGPGPRPARRRARRGVRAATARPGHDLACPASRSDRSLTSRTCSTRSTSSARSTTATATWSSPPPAPARPSLPRWTTGGLCATTPARRPSLLFVAHRKEILEQSLRTYREVLARRHLRRAVRRRRTTRALAARVRQRPVADRLRRREHPGRRLRHRGDRRVPPRRRPRPTGGSSTTCSRASCSGLTATPERADGLDVAAFFDGRTAAELRLWDALGDDLLCPFHYFAVADGTDLRRIGWARGRYDEAAAVQPLHRQPSPSRHRPRSSCGTRSSTPARCARSASASASRTPSSWRRPSRRRASPRWPSAGRRPAIERAAGAGDLRARRVNVLFAADLFNEGLDLPDVDTVLFLRPTESATLFLQQLGRGLRRTRDKAVLTVLDFVGHHRKEFRFDTKLRALTGETRAASSARSSAASRSCRLAARSSWTGSHSRSCWRTSAAQVAQPLDGRWSPSCGPTATSTWRPSCDESGLELPDVLREATRSWTELRATPACRPARVLSCEKRAAQARPRLRPRRRRLRATAYGDLLRDDAPAYAELSPAEQRLARDALLLALARRRWTFVRTTTGWQRSRDEPAARDELRAVIDLAFDAARHRRRSSLGAHCSDVPLRVHAPLPARRDPGGARLREPAAQAATRFEQGVLVRAETRTSTRSSSP